MTSNNGGSERRSNKPLRETIDDLIDLVRDLTRNSPEMTADELDYAQKRLEWFAEEIWRSATEGE